MKNKIDIIIEHSLYDDFDFLVKNLELDSETLEYILKFKILPKENLFKYQPYSEILFNWAIVNKFEAGIRQYCFRFPLNLSEDNILKAIAVTKSPPQLWEIISNRNNYNVKHSKLLEAFIQLCIETDSLIIKNIFPLTQHYTEKSLSQKHIEQIADLINKTEDLKFLKELLILLNEAQLIKYLTHSNSSIRIKVKQLLGQKVSSEEQMAAIAEEYNDAINITTNSGNCFISNNSMGSITFHSGDPFIDRPFNFS